MKLKITTQDDGLTVRVTDENGNQVENVKKISIQPFVPGQDFIVANIECCVELDVECYQCP
ncbi:MAG: hypothetical protein GQ532_09885 [Methylomarinum sp.]|nr:hypothetical protein [Methylomarinum sp.]